VREAPTLETARLVLRPFRESDIEAQSRAMGDPGVVRHLGGTPFSREDAWRRLLCAPGLWNLLGYGYWAVVEKDGGAYVGQIGFADFKRDLEPNIEGLPEMGWILAPEMHGRGYATEAVVAAIAWADATLDAPELTAIIDHANTASIRVAEKSGFSIREEAVYRGAPILLFRRRR
jgi:RimJ/RimL family protein N-acetyltransferase